MRGQKTCQSIQKETFHIAGVTGTIELPWVKQVVIKNEKGEITYRRRMFLMKGEDGEPVLVVQPTYPERADGLGAIDIAVMDALQKRYGVKTSEGGLGMDIRDIQDAVSKDNGVEGIGSNSGYGTFDSGRSPFFYIDSNAFVVFRNDGSIGGRHGLHYRPPNGAPWVFGKGWNTTYSACFCLITSDVHIDAFVLSSCSSFITVSAISLRSF